MRTWSRFLLCALSACAGAVASAQIIRVEVTSPVNESSTPYNPNSSPASAVATVVPAGSVSIASFTPGTGYTAAPTVTITGGGGTGAAATAIFVPATGDVTGLTISNSGTGYTSAPTISLTPPGPGGTPAVATASFSPGIVNNIAVTTAGSGFSSSPIITISGGGGSGATATATVSGGAITGVTVNTPGTGYTSAPVVSIAAPPGVITVAARVTGVAAGGVATTTFSVNGKLISTAIPGSNPQTAWSAPQPGSYFITASTTDSFGNAALSQAVRVFVTGTKVFSPIAHTAMPLGSSIVISGDGQVGTTAVNPFTGQTVFTPGFIKSMKFEVFNGAGANVSTQTATAAPYSVQFTPPALGFYRIQATATDNNDQTFTSQDLVDIQVVRAIGTPPTSRIVNPIGNGSVAAGTAVNIIADAGWAATEPNPGKIAKVEFYLDGALLSTATTFPFTSAWTPTVPGRYTLVALAFDDKGNVISSTPTLVNVTGGLPSVQLTSPATAGTTLVQGTRLTVAVSAAGSDGGIASLKSVELLVDGNVYDSLPKANPTTGELLPLTEPFTFTWRSNVALGVHRLAARVTDKSNLTITSAEVPVTVIANQLPSVAVTGPSIGTSFSPNTAVTIAATANDPDGSVDNVEFFVNGVSLGAPVTKPPFQITWTPTNAGPYVITAKVTDNAGATVTSPEVNVTVETAPSGTTDTIAGSGASNSVYRGNYGSATESGAFALGVNRNGRGTFIGYSTSPTGRTYFWTDIPINLDGTFTVRDSAGAAVLSGQTSATGVSGTFGDKTFIGPITLGATTPLLFSGTLEGSPNSPLIAIVGGDGSITIYSATGNNREAGSDLLTATGGFSFQSSGGGRITGTATPSAGIVSGNVTGAVSGSFLIRQQVGRLVNISTRSVAGAGERTLVAGFVIRGTGLKPLLIRGVGPTLANFGVSNPLPDPVLNVISSSGALMATNNDWGNSSVLANAAAQLGAFALNASSRDAAVQTALAPGTYSAVIGAGSATGNALIELYDADGAGGGTARITNISTRALVSAGDPLVAGFVIAGDQRKKLLIRAVGPTLNDFNITGTLPDPKLEILTGTSVITSNNDWSTNSDLAAFTATSGSVGAFPLRPNSRDAALVVQLNPGAYTVQVTGVGTPTGVVLVEIYDADL
jgi:hypothetical protein